MVSSKITKIVKARVADFTTRLRWARKCQLGKGAKVVRPGRIENIQGLPQAISLGNCSVVRGRLLTYGHAGQIHIGEYCYIGERTEIWSGDTIRIGDRVLISHDVNIHDCTAHSLDAVERHSHFRQLLTTGHPITCPCGVRSAPITIEDDVWISFGVTILKGVTIGRASVIAAMSVVTKDVPPYSLYRSEVTPVISKLPVNPPEQNPA